MKKDITLICQQCSVPLVGKQQKYCSHKCRMVVTNAKFQNFLEQNKRGAERKLAAIKAAGGCCSECGYNKNLASLCFHHLKDKSFSLDFRAFANRSPKLVQEEIAKCVVLCHNCHHEEHYPEMALYEGVDGLELRRQLPGSFNGRTTVS